MFTIFTLFFMVQAASPVGMVLQMEGRVTITRDGRTVDAKLAELLFPGDQIAGAATLLFCPSAEKLSVQGTSAIELRADGFSVLRGRAPSKSAARCTLPKTALGAENLERVGGVRARGDDVPALPLYIGGPITMTRPRFDWGPVAGARSYTVIVRDSDSTVLLEQQTSSTDLTYPLLKPGLKAGKYEWEVRAMAAGKLIARETAEFEVKPAPLSLRSILTIGGRLQSRADAMMRAVDLENEGFFAEAATFYRQLRESQPDDVRLTQRLAVLYWNAGLVEAANQESQKLK
ncbi:MAG: hypothetical protein HY646_02865 [Acidobacteria bacterium]|nr:hypothetical protein [Acidobacteriota bacterium]